jgi:hypothetical protein
VITVTKEDEMSEPTKASTDLACGINTPARTWVRPKVNKMRAGDAEIGPNPDNADGAFTFS